MATHALACTGDPLLDLMLGGCTSFSLRPAACETVAEALREAEALRPALLFTNPALGDIRPLLTLKGMRAVLLIEGPVPDGADGLEVLAAERLTPELVDAWLRRPARPASPPPSPAAPPATGAAQPGPPPVKPGEGRVAGLKVPPPAPSPAPLPAAGPTAQPPATSPAHLPAPPATPAPGSRPAPGRPHPQPQARRPEPARPVLSVLRQQVITFWGGKPGAGRSTLAVALSDLLSRAGAIKVCTVDLNPVNSSLAALVGKEQAVPSWFHLSESLARSGPFPVEALRWVRPNWAVVTGPDARPDWVAALTPQAIDWLVDGLRSQFDYIILDPEARPGPVSEAALRLAQSVLITVAADYPDVLDTTRSFEAALEAGFIDRGRCRLLLNRWHETPHLPAADVADCFGIPVSLTIPANAEAVVQASSQGTPVTGLEAPAAKALAAALHPLVGLVAQQVLTGGTERPGLFRALFQR